MLKLKSNVELNHMKDFHSACKNLNEINKKIDDWDENFMTAKESFVDKCRERRLQLKTEISGMEDAIKTIYNKYNNVILYNDGAAESKKLFETLKICEEDDENTFNAINELGDEEPHKLDELTNTKEIVENEY